LAVKSLRLTPNQFAATAAVVMLAACGGSQSPIGAPGAMLQGSANASRAAHGESWMLSEAKTKDLLYVTEFGIGDVNVFSYPQGSLVGTLTGFIHPLEDCTDRAGDVFITNDYSENIFEYAHGGTSPIATFTDPPYTPFDCSVDPITGNLAVTQYAPPGSGRGNLAIYSVSSGRLTEYKDPSILTYIYCGYDKAGNLFVDGDDANNHFAFAELPAGNRTFENIKLDRGIGSLGAIQWDGKHLAAAATGRDVIYQLNISGGRGSEVGVTRVHHVNHELRGFWIQGATVIVANVKQQNGWPFRGTVLFYNYPLGGEPTETLSGLDGPGGVTVSRAPR
jgi:hypothetical protein